MDKNQLCTMFTKDPSHHNENYYQSELMIKSQNNQFIVGHKEIIHFSGSKVAKGHRTKKP